MRQREKLMRQRDKDSHVSTYYICPCVTRVQWFIGCKSREGAIKMISGRQYVLAAVNLCHTWVCIIDVYIQAM